MRRTSLQVRVEPFAGALAADAAHAAEGALRRRGGYSRTPLNRIDLLDLVANPSFIAWNVAASLAQPIYRGGALKAQANQALAVHEAAVLSFSGIALRAFREVESALAEEHSLVKQYEFLETELSQATLAETQATRDYSEGIVGYLSVLEAQRRAFNARSGIIGLRNARLQCQVDLHLALGGDFADASQQSGQESRGND